MYHKSIKDTRKYLERRVINVRKFHGTYMGKKDPASDACTTSNASVPRP